VLKVLKKYEHLIELNSLKDENTKIAYEITKITSYTNFNLTTLRLSNLESSHLVNIYRFWSFDPVNNIPNEAYFSKLTNLINTRNPAFFNVTFISFQRPKYHKELNNVGNYLIHSRFVSIKSNIL
jgi:hypothetical protein